MAGAQKKARREGRLIVFIDESGLSERPTRVRTWALKGQTPVIQFHFNWTHISVIAGLSRTNFMFRLHEGSIKKEQHVEFLKALRAHLKRPLLIIWDGLKARRSKLVREYLDSTEGEVQMAFLPPYSPDLNPIEKYFAKLKHWLRKAARRTPETVYSAISKILPKTKPHECSNFFAQAGYGKARIISL